jgi:flagellar protein FliS
MTDAHREYTQSRVLTADPVEIVHLLYQIAIDNLNTAIACLQTGDIFGRSRAVTKAQGAVDELMFALDRKVDAPFSRTLADLYAFIRLQITAGHVRRTERAFRDALRVLTTLSEGWDGVRTRVSGDNQTAGTEELPEATRQAKFGSLYAEPPWDSGTVRDWSC